MKPIALQRNYFFDESKVGVIGHGTDVGTLNTISERLRFTEIPIDEDGSCEFIKDFRQSVMICVAGNITGRPLYGDSGGSAFIFANGRYVQIGIVSHGIDSDGYRLILTRVSWYYDWIMETMDENDRIPTQIEKDEKSTFYSIFTNFIYYLGYLDLSKVIRF